VKRAAAKRAAAFAITAAMIGGALWYARAPASRRPDEPENAVWRLLDESRSGSVDRYLDCFTGGMRAQLEATARGMSLPKFSDYLKESVGKVKGVAVYDVVRPGPEEAALVVEYVYQDRNERQRMALKLQNGSWRIASAEGSERIQPLIPYGKPVSEVQ
jgi:hypothetical protein